MIIKTFEEEEYFIDLYKERKAEVVILSSKGGLSKTRTTKEKLKNVKKDTFVLYVNAHSTPLSVFKALVDNKDKFIYLIIDDCDEVLKNGIFVSLMKKFSDCEEWKEIQYNTTSPLLEGREQKCKVRGNLLVLCNKFSENNPNIKALIDRGYYINFIPDNKTIFEKIIKIDNEKNKEVTDFLKENYEGAINFSIRTYVKCIQLKDFDDKTWKEVILRDMQVDEKQIKINKILNSKIKKSEKVKILAEMDDSDITKDSKIRKYQRLLKVKK